MGTRLKHSSQGVVSLEIYTASKGHSCFCMKWSKQSLCCSIFTLVLMAQFVTLFYELLCNKMSWNKNIKKYFLHPYFVVRLLPKAQPDCDQPEVPSVRLSTYMEDVLSDTPVCLLGTLLDARSNIYTSRSFYILAHQACLRLFAVNVLCKLFLTYCDTLAARSCSDLRGRRTLRSASTSRLLQCHMSGSQPAVTCLNLFIYLFADNNNHAVAHNNSE